MMKIAFWMLSVGVLLALCIWGAWSHFPAVFIAPVVVGGMGLGFGLTAVLNDHD